jgi:hypothetical protein
MTKLEKICFLYYKDGRLCNKKCDGHNEKCRLYTPYDPKKKLELSSEYFNYRSKEKK